MRTIELQVPTPPQPARLDMFVTANLHGVSRRRVKTLIDAESVRVNGRIERRGGRKLNPGDNVQVSYRPSKLVAPEPLPADALLESGTDWWAVNKPAGVPTHRTDDDGLGVPELAEALFDGADDVHPAHRLDRGTSGVLLLARGEARSALAQAFEQREVGKRYLAVVSPPPDQQEGTLDGVDGEGRPMHCSFRVLRRVRGGQRAELSVSPREGRTHQIRILLAAAGWPIVGDLEHGRPLPGGAARMALHCAELRWEERAVGCQPPAGWEALLDPEAAEGAAAAGSSKAGGKAKAGGKRKRLSKAEAWLEASNREADTGTKSKRPVDGGRPLGNRKQLMVSRATARIVGAGHPWVIVDKATGSREKLRLGDVINLVDPGKRFVAMAIADPKATICARVVSKRQLETLDGVGWRSRAEHAIERRSRLLDDPETNALRLIHGQADGLPGMWVDLWGDCLVVTRLARCCKAFTESVYEVLEERFAGLPLYQKDHWTDLRAEDGQGSDALAGRWIRPPSADHPASKGPWVVREAGAEFLVQPTEGLTTGFYPDQRKNRRKLDARLAAVGDDADSWVGANLFAHTGAFSVSLARAGVGRVYTVDVSPKYLDVYRQNLALNGLEEADHPAVAADAMVWLETAPALNVVVLDPPAFAKKRGRGRGWNAQRDYANLVAAAARVLEPGGLMLCCHNLRSAKKGWLRSQVEKGLATAGRRLVNCEPAGPASDHPTVKGFPEGHTFRGLLVTVR